MTDLGHEMPQPKLQLRVGGYYRNRNGHITQIIEFRRGRQFSWADINCQDYRDNGSYSLRESVKSDFDLIAECNEDGSPLVIKKPSAPEWCITKDTPVQTREGREVRVLAVDLVGEYPIAYAAKSCDDNIERLHCCYPNGRRCSDGETDLDLVPAPPKPKVYEAWMNISPEYHPEYHAAFLYATKEEADKCAASDRIDCIYLTGTSKK